MLIKTESIIVPQMFLESKPRQSKVSRHYDYYNKHNKLMKKIIIDSNYQVADGYIDYLIAVENNIDMVECLFLASGCNPKSKSDRIRIINILMQKSNGKCSICGCHLHTNKFANKKYYATIDHIIPLSKGGENHIDNMQIACTLCNQIKGSLLPTSFMNHISLIKEVSTNA